MLLIPHDSQLGDEMKKLRSTLPQIEIREVDESLKTKITVIVVDKTESFIFETKDDDASALENAVGESVHYSGGGTSLSIASIFYSLWRQAELYEKLKGVDSIKDEFVNIAAHELRTPILPIILSAENLQDRYPNDENVKVILRNATRMIKLAGDILDVSRIDSSTLILQKQKNNIINLIQEVIQDSLVKIPDSKGLQIIRISDVPVDMREFLFDKNRVRQVVENLLDNAIKFSQGGTIKIAISKNPKDERQVAVSVIDEGEGINPSLKDKLFEKFISEPSQTNGTGLGLYICRALVQAHGGTIDAKPNPMGQGAIFTFTLPFSDGVHIS